MKKLFIKSFTFITAILLFVSCEQNIESDYRNLVKLNGTWKFNIGDDLNWASPSFDDKEWSEIYAPSNWEDQGYVGYDGFAWFRKTIYIPSISNKRTLFLSLGAIDDADEVYLNGHLIGKTGEFPPNYLSAYDWDREYIIPVELIKPNAENVIAIRIYDAEMDGGFTAGNITIRINEDEELLDLNLAGDWKFKLYDDTEWKNPSFNDSKWETIKVPMTWESQKHFNYDGYAWYRKSFTLPSELKGEKLYLVLGKIDDYDRVYLNGEIIGEVSPRKVKNMVRSWDGNEHNTRRIYRIPADALKDGLNLIAVRVYDSQLRGGIYDGPVGLMQEKNMRAYKKSKYTKESEIVNDIFSELFGKDSERNF